MQRKYPGWASCLKEWMCPPGSLAKGSGALWASVKRQREEVCNPLWPMGHGQMSVWGHTRTFLFHKQVRHTHSFHTYINIDRQTHTHAHPKETHSSQSSNPHLLFWRGFLLWTPSWQTKFGSKREQRAGRKGRGKQTKRPPLPQPPRLPHSPSRHWLMAQALLFPFC